MGEQLIHQTVNLTPSGFAGASPAAPTDSLLVTSYNTKMNNAIFYNSAPYKERQSAMAKANWQKGVYDFLRQREERKCAYNNCGEIFITQPADIKRFCSRKCAAKVNNPKRSSITTALKREIEKLYKRGFSLEEISGKIGFSSHFIRYWMDKDGIPRRSRSEAAYVKWNPNGDPFKIKLRLSKKEEALKGLGLGLYWGEGDKSPNNTSVRLGNTDPILIKRFREFLIKICGVDQAKIKYNLMIFNDGNVDDAVSFWRKHLGIHKKQLGKITVIPPQGKGTYKRKNMFGVLMIIVNNKKLKERILEMIEAINLA